MSLRLVYTFVSVKPILLAATSLVAGTKSLVSHTEECEIGLARPERRPGPANEIS